MSQGCNGKDETPKVINLTGKGRNLIGKGRNLTGKGTEKDKGFKTVIGDYGFMMWQSMWHRRTRLGIIFKIGLLYGIFFIKCCILGQSSNNSALSWKQC